MTQYCDGIEFPTESLECVICLKEIGSMKLQERSEWDWNEDCLFKIFEIEPGSLEGYPSLTYFCQDCTLRNQNIWELYSQIHLLQKSLQEIKVTLEYDFKRSFRFEDAHGKMDRSGCLRYQLAKSIKILPPELSSSSSSQNFEREYTPTSPKPSPVALEAAFVIHEVPAISRDCSADFSSTLTKQETSEESGKTERLSTDHNVERTPGKEKLQEKENAGSKFLTLSYSEDSIKTVNPNIPKECLEVTSKEPGNVDRPLNDSKGKPRTGRTKTQRKGFENGISQFPVNQKNMKLKDLSIKIFVIPPDLLNNPPVNVHTIPGYVPTPTVRSSGRVSKSRLKIARILESESQSDVEIVSDNDVDFNVEDIEDAEYSGVTVRKDVRKSKIANPTKRKRKKYTRGTKNRFYCDLPECDKTPGFNSKEQLEVHNKKVHQGITHPFKCEECGKAFRFLAEKNVHYKKAHLGEFTFRCEFCGKGFSGRLHLQKHRVIHTGERNFKCSECPMDFKTALGRVMHIRYTHTGERPYICHICGKGLVSATVLKYHIKCVHNREERPLICHICGKNFPVHGYLHMHMKTHEKEDAVAAGLPVKRRPPWKKKCETATVEESFPNPTNTINTIINNHGGEGTFYPPLYPQPTTSVDAETSAFF